MKMYLKIAALCVPLFMVTPSIAQVSWGVDLRFGTPVPHEEVIVAPPNAGAVWEPGYSNYVGYRNVWFPGRWHERGWVAPRRYYGGDREREYRGERYAHHDRDDRGRGDERRGNDRGHEDFQRGRIR
jgi:hypothetical protein